MYNFLLNLLNKNIKVTLANEELVGKLFRLYDDCLILDCQSTKKQVVVTFAAIQTVRCL